VDHRYKSAHYLFAASRIFFIAVILCLCIFFFDRPASAYINFRGDYNYRPYEFLDNGIPSGFNVDIIRAVSQALGIDIKIDLGPWKEVRNQLENKEIEALTGMYESPARDRYVDFSMPLIIVSHSMFVRDDLGIRSQDDLKGKNIAVIRGDIMHDYAIKNFSDSSIIPVDSYETAINMLSAGEFDCALLGKLQGLYWVANEDVDNVRSVGEPMMAARYCFAVREGDNELLAQLNEGLFLIKKSGEYDRIYNKWFGVYEQKALYRKLMLRSLWAIGPLLFLLCAFILWSWTLRRKVRIHTKALRHELEERQKAEIALKISEEHYRTIFNSIMDGFYYCDLEGNIKTANPSAAKILGYEKPDDIVGLNAAKDIYLDFERRTDFLDQINEFGFTQGYEAEVKRFDGSVITVEINSKLMRDPVTGKIEGIAGVFRDITRRRRMETIMVQTEKMMSLGSMASGIAHELNNPLAAIVGNAQNLETRILKKTGKNLEIANDCGLDYESLQCFLDKRKISEIIHGIMDSGAKAASVVSNMLSFSGNSGYFAWHNILSIIEDSINLASNDYNLIKKYDFRNIEIVRDYAANLPHIYCDRSEIQQALFNILRNGAEAVSKKVYKNDRARFHITARRDNDMLEIVIGDNGPGMSNETNRRIFEPFFTTKPVGEGIGLGLSISYFIIEDKHGGHITIKSSFGEYTRVAILLPVAGPNK
jgi:PAS domain S-box-containing protein